MQIVPSILSRQEGGGIVGGGIVGGGVVGGGVVGGGVVGQLRPVQVCVNSKSVLCQEQNWDGNVVPF